MLLFSKLCSSSTEKRDEPESVKQESATQPNNNVSTQQLLSQIATVANSTSDEPCSKRLKKSQNTTHEQNVAVCGSELNDLFHRGQFSSLWLTKTSSQSPPETEHEQRRVVKCFNPENSREFQNSSLIYSVIAPNCHASFLRFFGEHPILESSIVLEWVPNGTLHDHLEAHTLSWPIFSRVIDGLVKGIAFLHSEHPSIVHCGLNSHSVLLTNESRVKICDLSHAVCFDDALSSASAPQSLVAHQQPCYLSPEVLVKELTDKSSESALKHSDIYSLALLLWQIASRCRDLYQGVPVPEHRRPYELELGESLCSFEQVRVLVAKHRARPLFPDIWKDSNPAIRQLKETIADAWDHEPEARLTALCIEERISELPLLWAKFRADILVARGLVDSDFRDNCNRPDITGRRKEICYIVNQFDKPTLPVVDSNNNNTSTATRSPLREKNFNRATLNKPSTCEQPKITLPLQPHQARNLCVQRNLMRCDTSPKRDIKLLHQGEKFQYEKKCNNLNVNNVPVRSSRLTSEHPTQTHSDLPTQDALSHHQSHSANHVLPNQTARSDIPFRRLPVAPIQLNVQNRFDTPLLSVPPSTVARRPKNTNCEREHRNRENSSPHQKQQHRRNLFAFLRSRLSFTALKESPFSSLKHHSKISGIPRSEPAPSANNTIQRHSSSLAVVLESTTEGETHKLLQFDGYESVINTALIL